jgi:hypothetical protein
MEQMPRDRHHRERDERLNHFDAQMENEPGDEGAHHDGKYEEPKHVRTRSANRLPTICEQHVLLITIVRVASPLLS